MPLPRGVSSAGACGVGEPRLLRIVSIATWGRERDFHSIGGCHLPAGVCRLKTDILVVNRLGRSSPQHLPDRHLANTHPHSS